MSVFAELLQSKRERESVTELDRDYRRVSRARIGQGTQCSMAEIVNTMSDTGDKVYGIQRL